jgi:hypothetical protein
MWAAGLDGEWPWNGRPRDVYRLECRFGKTLLKERNLRRPHEIAISLPPLIAEALYARRLTITNAQDGHRHRWPLHPLWSEALRRFNARDFVPIGRKVTGRRSALVQAREKALAGILRSGSVLMGGEFNESNVIALVTSARHRIEHDPRHTQKVEIARNRYSDVDEAG